ncbi:MULTISPECIES: type IV secretion system DNA-binding domain-containing protein [Pseudomonas syringae group]|uniref:type IV secretion system DNA-binding domain-containing protein n=1 Tax=Pseudomonas syringae group TaxID=136849 RepID=UPI0006B8FFCF|nr:MULTISPECIES: type IV secretion system DNA-binding domain-containing protein [Pseudomonas syringae group]KPB82042.1 TrwB integral membrane protein [Pseudomonas syringae pv. maculicola]NAP32573.1 type IV secretion system DNA-binding domain-containing protein [Pseudomonas syringae]
MRVEDRRQFGLILVLLMPTVFWSMAVKRTEVLTPPKWKAGWELIKHTHEKPILLASALGGLFLAFFLIWCMSQLGKSDFGGAPFKKFIRGTKTASPSGLTKKTKEKDKEQVTIAGIPMPIKVENLHLLVQGATGSGKSVLMREMAYTSLKRRDRAIFLDPNGDMFSKFGGPKDIILNPYDERTQGWTFFNEIRTDYDFHRYALSIVPRGKTADAEEWAAFGRLLLRETARKLKLIGKPSVYELFHWTTIADPEDLRKFLTGTMAESLFAGSSEASKALTSARFVLSDKLPEHLSMPPGDFSIRTWLEEGEGNLFITWREDMAEALKPLISAWIDAAFVSILSMPEDENRNIWAYIDELASLEKLASLEAALTKGRKHGLRVVAGLQSTSQLDDIYGRDLAQTLRSCFRSLAVLGGSKTDPKTGEDMSKALGQHEVERDKYSKSTGTKTSLNTSEDIKTENVVTASEIASLPDLTGYIAFAGDFPIAKFKLVPMQFKRVNEPFIVRAA